MSMSEEQLLMSIYLEIKKLNASNRLWETEDRCHRIGQTKKVLYIDICSDAGIDERIMNSLAIKGNAVERFKEEVDKVKESNKNQLKELIRGL